MKQKNSNPRAVMNNTLPRIFQPFLTWLTGCANPGQKPLFVLGAISQTVLTVLGLAACFTLIIAILN